MSYRFTRYLVVLLLMILSSYAEAAAKKKKTADCETYEADHLMDRMYALFWQQRKPRYVVNTPNETSQREIEYMSNLGVFNKREVSLIYLLVTQTTGSESQNQLYSKSQVVKKLKRYRKWSKKFGKSKSGESKMRVVEFVLIRSGLKDSKIAGYLATFESALDRAGIAVHRVKKIRNTNWGTQLTIKVGQKTETALLKSFWPDRLNQPIYRQRSTPVGGSF